jgi:HEAT repeat protein
MQIDFNKLDADYETRRKLVDEMLNVKEPASRNKLIDDMIAALRSPGFSNGVKATIVYVLGKLKAEQAIPVLIELLNVSLIDFSEKSPVLKSEAAGALVEIGPAIKNPLLEHFNRTTDEAIRLQIGAMLYNVTRNKSEVKAMLRNTRTAAANTASLDDLDKKIDEWK